MVLLMNIRSGDLTQTFQQLVIKIGVFKGACRNTNNG